MVLLHEEQEKKWFGGIYFHTWLFMAAKFNHHSLNKVYCQGMLGLIEG